MDFQDQTINSININLILSKLKFAIQEKKYFFIKIYLKKIT